MSQVVASGHAGEIELALDAAAVGTVPQTVAIESWDMVATKEMVEITSPRQVSKDFWPHHGTTIIRIVGWLAQGTHPGTFHTKAKVTATLRSDRADTNKKWVIAGWLRVQQVSSAVDAPTQLIGEIVGGEPVVTWT